MFNCVIRSLSHGNHANLIRILKHSTAYLDVINGTSDLRIIQQKRYYAEKKRGKRKHVEVAVVKQTKSTKKIVDVYSDMNARELAEAIEVNFDDVTDVLVGLDKKNLDIIAEEKSLDKEWITKAVTAFGAKPKLVPRPSNRKEQTDDLLPQPSPPDNECTPRPPVVTIMGHVDHGKTTLLDALRNSQIAAGEFGGITQHIGAFSVELKGSGRRVTFLDTPGHAAFAAMRSRGAQGADVVVLVVAADDGVKEQTVQSIKFAQSAGVPIVVAVNKCDKPNADPVRATRSLLEHGIVTEDFGGEVQAVLVSALQSRNLPALQEAILMQADMMDLKSTSNGLVEGLVIESSVVHGIGKVCTVVVSRGSLTKNNILVAGNSWCRVRSLTDEQGRAVSVAGPSTPVRISGWKDDLPSPGDLILQTTSTDKAQKAVAFRVNKQMEEKANKDWEATEEKRQNERAIYLANRQILLDRGQRFGSTLRNIVHKKNKILKQVDDGFPKLKIMFRTDVEGTLEAIMEVIDTYSAEDQCKLQVVDFEVGPPTERDIETAKETGALIWMFNVQPSASIRQAAEKEGIRMDHFNVIYRLVESLKNELSSKLPTQTELELVGEGHVLKEFMISDRARKRQPIAGVLVDWGNFGKNCVFKFSRGGKVIYEGEIESMKKEMEVVTTAKTNTEVGIALEDKNIRFKEDDSVEVFEKKEVKQIINWNPPGF